MSTRHVSFRFHRALVAPLHASRTAAAVAAWFLVAVLGSTVQAQTTTESLDLIGPVATLTVYQTYEPESEEPRLRQEMTFAPDGVATSRTSYSYSFRDGSLRSRSVTTYDAGQRLAVVVYDADDVPTGQTVFRYDGDGRLVEEVTFDAEGVETRKTTNERDADGNVTKQVWYRDGAVRRTIENDYDASGRLVEQRTFDDEDRLIGVETYSVPDLEYEFVQYDDDGAIESRSLVVRDEYGAVSAETYLPDGTLEDATYFVRDENGRLLERRDIFTYESMGTVTTGETMTVYEYEFDDVGNWLRTVTLEDDGSGTTPISLSVREITYH